MMQLAVKSCKRCGTSADLKDWLEGVELTMKATCLHHGTDVPHSLGVWEAVCMRCFHQCDEFTLPTCHMTVCTAHATCFDLHFMSVTFRLQGMRSAEEQMVAADQRTSQYRGFGTASSLLGYAASMMPVGGDVLNLSNSVGAALWAADIETKEKGRVFVGKRKAS